MFPAGPTYLFEALSEAPVAGVDEVGRGPMAGPVVAAAVILRLDAIPDGLADSKLLRRSERERLYALLRASADIGVGAASVAEIARHNVLGATFLAMRRAVARLRRPPATVLVDGNQRPPLPCATQMLVRGDSRSLSIAAASIVAKVVRDRLMTRLASRYPAYGWEHNAGYCTAEHRAALARAGATVHHREGFRPVRDLAAQAALFGDAPPAAAEGAGAPGLTRESV